VSTQTNSSDISAGQRHSKVLATGGLALSGMAIGSYILLALCVIGFLGGCVLAGIGTAKGVKLLQMAGIVVAVASLVWAGVFGMAAMALSVAQVGAVALNVAALAKAGKTNEPGAGNWRALAIAGVVVGGAVLVFFAVSLGLYYKQQSARHRELDADYIVRVAGYVEPYRLSSDEDWHFAPSLAAAEIHSHFSFMEGIMHMPSGHLDRDVIPFSAKESDWPLYAAAIDEKCDYRYVGNDLVRTRGFRAFESRIVILYNKASYGGGRTVAFADHKQRFVKDADLPAVFADASAARAALGLPPITLDGPAPTPPAP